MKTCRQAITLLTLIFFCLTATAMTTYAAKDPLPSWKDTAHKKAIIKFVKSVTKKGSLDFVPKEYRIATFDQDGTIFVEKPLIVLFEHLYHFYENPTPNPRFGQLAIVGRQPGGYALASNETLVQAYKGYTTEEYRDHLFNFVKTQKHPRFNVPYFDLFYQPMLELITYLQAKKFRVYVVSGSWQVFVRTLVGEKLGLPKSNLVGTQTDLAYKEGKIVLAGSLSLPTANTDGKPGYIENHIGEKPILAFGNSNGDQQMFEYTATNERKHLILWVDHDDEEREYVYDSHVKPQPEWLKISMKNDFATVFGK